jgi:L-ascorbate metabolism protein UlaG (beta-lactamase superfamily)
MTNSKQYFPRNIIKYSTIAFILISAILTLNPPTLGQNPQKSTKKPEVKMIKNIHWLGHDSFRLMGDKIIYIDPWKIGKNAPKADIILVTHSHYDHLSPSDIASIQKETTNIVIPADAKSKLSGKLHIMAPGEKLELQGITVEAVPAYNIDKQFHPKANKWLGYIITVEGERIYHAGDTDFIPEMANFKCDIALLPVSGTYVMTAKEAVNAVSAIKPKTAIPMHYGDIVGSKADAEYFKKNAGCEVVILPKE